MRRIGRNSGQLLRKKKHFRGADWRVNEAFVPADHGGETFVIRERACGSDLDEIALSFDWRVVLSRTVDSGVGDGVQAGDTRRAIRFGGNGLDGNVPLITCDVPVEFVVIVGKSNGIEDSIVEYDGFRSVFLRPGSRF